MEKDNRTLKVYGMSNKTPIIMMKGKWLENFGFKVGQKYNVDCQNGK
jgi:HSP20-like domain of unknown function (DUF1813)